jgi:hypothetical protein
VGDFPWCAVGKRQRFDKPGRVERGSPDFVTAVFYLGPDVRGFVAAFSPLGRVYGVIAGPPR